MTTTKCRNCGRNYEPVSQVGLITASGRNVRRIDLCCPKPEPEARK